MAGILGTTVVHGNHGYFQFDGKVVGRVKNVNMTVEGGLDEFYEVGSAWLADHEVIQRKVNVSIERGAIDFELLAYAVGIQANLDGDNTTFIKSGSEYDLIIDEGTSNVLTVSDPNGNQVMTAPFVLDVIIAVNKIVDGKVKTYFVTARDCKIIRHGISAPNSAYWTSNLDLTGKQIALGGITHKITA